MFGSIQNLLKKPVKPRPKKLARRRFTLGFETLEGREVPAALAFVSPAGVYGAAAVNGPSTAQTRSLLSSNSGDMVSKSSGWSQAHASLSNYSGASYYKTVDTTTSAYGSGTSLATYASAWTTKGYGAFDYVSISINATSGEQQGQGVQVTFTPSFVSTIGTYNQGSASNTYHFYVNGGDYLAGTDTSKGTETFKRSLTFNSTIGSTISIAFYSKSYVGASNSIGNTAKMDFSLAMSVSTSGGGGGQTSAPAAPNQPFWSSAGGSDIYLQWNNVAGETSYVVQYWNQNSGNWVTLGTVAANSTSVRITYGLGYYWRIGASNGYGTKFSPYVLAK